MKKTISLFLLVLFLISSFGIRHSAFASDYVLSSGDQLEVRIIGQKDLDTKQSIAPDGTISLPLAGRVNVAGMTLAELDKHLIAEFSKYIEKPQIVVYHTEKPDWWEKNWYKVITAVAVLVGIYATLHK